MAIYTTKNFGMLTAEPLDSKRVMTFDQWDTDDTAGLSYPGQLYYDPETGWFDIYGKYVDGENYAERPIFGLNIDGISIYSSNFLFGYFGCGPELDITYTNNNTSYYSNYGSGWVDMSSSDRNFNMSCDDNKISSNFDEYVFGTSNQIVSNNNNNVISMFGTGLKSEDPYCNQFIIGRYNSDDPDASFIFGNGDSNSSRSNSVTIYPSGEMYAKQILSPGDWNCVRNAVTAVEYLYVTVEEPTTTDTTLYTLANLPSGIVVDKVVIKISEAFEDGELLDIFTMKNNDKTYIIKDYPISKIPEGSLAIENMFTEIHDGAVYVWRHGIDYTKLPGYEGTTSGHIYGNFSGDAKVYISTSKDIHRLPW